MEQPTIDDPIDRPLTVLGTSQIDISLVASPQGSALDPSKSLLERLKGESPRQAKVAVSIRAGILRRFRPGVYDRLMQYHPEYHYTIAVDQSNINSNGRYHFRYSGAYHALYVATWWHYYVGLEFPLGPPMIRTKDIMPGFDSCDYGVDPYKNSRKNKERVCVNPTHYSPCADSVWYRLYGVLKDSLTVNNIELCIRDRNTQVQLTDDCYEDIDDIVFDYADGVVSHASDAVQVISGYALFMNTCDAIRRHNNLASECI